MTLFDVLQLVGFIVAGVSGVIALYLIFFG